MNAVMRPPDPFGRSAFDLLLQRQWTKQEKEKMDRELPASQRRGLVVIVVALLLVSALASSLSGCTVSNRTGDDLLAYARHVTKAMSIESATRRNLATVLRVTGDDQDAEIRQGVEQARVAGLPRARQNA